MAATAQSTPPAPIVADPALRKVLAIGAFALVALPGVVSALSYVTSDGFRGDEQPWLVRVREFAMQSDPLLRELLKPFSQALPALLVTSWFRRDSGRLSMTGWLSAGVLVSCIALGLYGSFVLEAGVANDLTGGQQALDTLRAFSQTTTQSAATYLLILFGISQAGGIAR